MSGESISCSLPDLKSHEPRANGPQPSLSIHFRVSPCQCSNLVIKWPSYSQQLGKLTSKIR